MDIVTAVDAGTSSIRAVLFDLSGSILAIHSYSYSPRFLSDGRVRQSPETWEQGLISVCTEAAATCEHNGYTPLCVSITGQRASVLPFGADNRPLTDAIMWQDKSTAAECDEIARRVPAMEVFETTGLRIDSYFSAPKILWLRNHMPEVFEGASRFLGVQDYITYLVTGEFSTDFSQASRTLLFDIHRLEWSSHLLTHLSIPVDMLPHAVPAGSSAGVTASGFCAKTGFRAGVPVILAGGDQQVAAVGMGVVEPGMAEANTGTGSFLITPVNAPALHPEMRTLCSVSAVAGQWVAEAGILTTGVVYEWFAREFAGSEAGGDHSAGESGAAMEELSRLASQAPAGANGVLVLPHFSGSAAPFWNPDARGIFANMTLSTTRADLARAVIESVALELAMNLELLSAMVGDIRHVRVAGGLTRLPLFNRIQADAFNLPVSVSAHREATAFGALISACIHLGLYSDHGEAYNAMASHEDERLDPDAQAHVVYAGHQEVRRALHDTIRQAGVYRAMRALLKPHGGP